MDSGSQQFCLKWNNYQSTLQHIFHKLWLSETFIDVSLVVEGRRIGCHKVVLSACSVYFEQLLKDHGNHPHPLVILHELPYPAVQSLVTFMYKGEVNVSQEELTALLKVAETLKIKGLADSAAISNFTKCRLMCNDPPPLHIPASKAYPNLQSATPSMTNTASPPALHTVPSVSAPSFSTSQPHNLSAARCNVMVRPPSQLGLSSNIKRREPISSSTSPKPKRKCNRVTENGTNSLSPSPTSSLSDSQATELSRSSPVTAVASSECPKLEPEEETDNELQIDESVGYSASEMTESDTHSNQNTPGPEIDPFDADRLESAESLASLATHGVTLNHNHLPRSNHHMFQSKPYIKEEKGITHSTKNGEKSYTTQDLEEGIERVLMRELTPAKAIAEYKIPRRTFFRRLSAVRKTRGIPSSKENASDHFLTSGSNVGSKSSAKSPIPMVIPGIVPTTQNSFLQSLQKSSKLALIEDAKKEQTVQGVMTTGSVFSLLTGNSNYNNYLNFLKLQNQKKEATALIISDKKDHKEITHTIDDNRNLAPSDICDTPLVAQNGQK